MNLSQCRQELNKIDDEILSLFLKRLNVVQNVAAYKKENNLPILHKSREDEIIKRIENFSGEEFSPYTKELFLCIMEISKKYQSELMK